MIFHENRLLADDSHEISYFIFSKIRKDVKNMSPAAVVIGALRVNKVTSKSFPCAHKSARANKVEYGLPQYAQSKHSS